jgi:hypothetical protein
MGAVPQAPKNCLHFAAMPDLPEALRHWLMNTVPGVIVLGALGSVLAVLLGKLYLVTVNRVLPVPYQLHRRTRRKQAYYLGGIHATINRDETGRTFMVFLAYRICRFALALFVILSMLVAVSTGLLLQSQTVATVALILGTTCAFLAVYWAIHEFEYVYRSYLVYWKGTIAELDEKHPTRHRAAPGPAGEPGKTAGLEDKGLNNPYPPPHKK